MSSSHRNYAVLSAAVSQQRKPLLVAFTALLLLRSRLLEIPQEALARTLERRGLSSKLSKEELAQALQQLYVKEPDGSKILLVPSPNVISKVSHTLVRQDVCTDIYQVPIKPTPTSQLAYDAKRFPLIPSTHKPSLDRASLRQLTAILQIAFPSWHSKESGIIALHSFFLVLRTVLSVAVARLDGRLVRDIVSADGKGFLKGLGLWFALAIPSTYTNTMVRAASFGDPHIKRRLTDSLDPPFASETVSANAHPSHALYTRFVSFLRA